MVRRALIVAIVTVIIAVSGLMTPRSAGAQEQSQTLTVYVAMCPEAYADDDFFGDCYGTSGDGVELSVTVLTLDDRPRQDGTTGVDGTVTFDIGDWVPARIRVSAIDPFSGSAIDGAIECSADGEPFAVVPGPDGRSNPIFDLEVATDADISCDLYVVPYATSRDLGAETDQTDEEGDTGEGAVTDLPNTGAGTAMRSNMDEQLLILGLVLTAGWVLTRLRPSLSGANERDSPARL